MFVLLYTFDEIGGNGAKVYQCIACGSFITRSDQIVPIGGTNRHLFVNPAGVECDFHTFLSCPGALAVGEATEIHTWFSGYMWRMAFCRECSQHLGWHYEAIFKSKRPLEFWGIMVSHVKSH